MNDASRTAHDQHVLDLVGRSSSFAVLPLLGAAATLATAWRARRENAQVLASDGV